MKSFQDDFPQVDNLCENDAVKLTDFDQDESASELMNDYKLMDDELLAGIPEIKCDCLKE